ncbi:GNAT family N-acetyltransferase [Cohnella terricola]|uniref:GNAT family N-acetyltransferase n=1 Tax=Cohnella terricola TaxID=1289167 RepID=A0A559IUX9_9BACL|nr:GNAT family N-acetyltransferase [Cohnella terricola]TVX91445.1 GNAT family N-acetyltransferase [Cohnella terricola]
MIIDSKDCQAKGLNYTIRSAVTGDAKSLSDLRLIIDGETENMDRESGEAYIDVPGFERIIEEDTRKASNLFLVAVVRDAIVGFSRCQGFELNRFSHKAEFGVCVLKDYWGYGIGQNLLHESTSWADANGIHKIALSVVETNDKAIRLYQKHGFEIEGILKKDRLHADGMYYNTVIMGRVID